MRALNHIISKILDQGVAAATGEFEKKRVRLTNQLSLVSLVVVCIFISTSILFGNLRNIALQGPVLFGLIIPPIILNRLHYFRLSRLALVIGCSLQVTLDACIGGRVEAHQFYFLPIGVGTGMLFRSNEYRLLSISLAIPLGCFLALEISDFSLLNGLVREQTQLLPLRYFNITVSYLVAAFIGWRFSALFIQSELHARNSSKMPALGEMAAGISHEINNPLTIISVSVDSSRRKLQNGSLDPVEINAVFDRIKSSSQRISRIIDGLRKFSRHGSHDPIVFVNVRKIVENALVLIKSRIHQNQIEGKIIERNPCEIKCRESDILQALVNIISNAVDAVSGLEQSMITVEWQVRNSTMELSVTDSGNGIAENIVEKIAQPFFTTKNPDEGTGLGLSIATGLVRANDGTLELDRESSDTRFVIRFRRFKLVPAAESLTAA